MSKAVRKARKKVRTTMKQFRKGAKGKSKDPMVNKMVAEKIERAGSKGKARRKLRKTMRANIKVAKNKYKQGS